MVKELNYFIFGSLFDTCEVMCRDVIGWDNVHFLNVQDRISNHIAHFLYKVHNSGIANKLVKLHFKHLWYKYVFDSQYIKTDGTKNVFLFFDSNPHLYNGQFLTWIRTRVANSRIVMLFVNSMKNRNMRDIDYFKSHSDLIYTTDPEDAKQYQFCYFTGIHSLTPPLYP